MSAPTPPPILIEGQKGIPVPSLLPEIPDDCLGQVSEPRGAVVSDVRSISGMINEYASAKIMLARGPQYIYENIKDYTVITVSVPNRQGVNQDVVVACGAVHVLWEDLAEIRSIAVHPKFHRRGLGSKIVSALIEESRALGIRRLFTFTLAVEFFQSFGFIEYPRNDIPPIVWVECSKCSKYYNCDETGMILQI